MFTFKQYITEIFDNPLPYKKVGRHRDDDYEYHEYSFSLGKNKPSHRVYITHEMDDDDVTHAEVAFHDSAGDDANHGHDAHRVLSTVKEIVKNHIRKHPEIGHIMFYGDKRLKGKKSSRTSLYTKILKKEGIPYKSKSIGTSDEFRIRVPGQ